MLGLRETNKVKLLYAISVYYIFDIRSSFEYNRSHYDLSTMNYSTRMNCRKTNNHLDTKLTSHNSQLLIIIFV